MSAADVLLVEDDAHEAELVVRALGPRVRVLTAPDGDSALEMMLAGPPRLVLLDLKMGGASEFDVLATVRGAPALASVPVVVLTSSSDPRHVARAYELGAHGYVVKPIVHARLVERLGAVTQFWLAAPADARDA